MITFYNRYLNEDDTDYEEDGRTKITDKMGYVSSVDDARQMLENLYKLKDNKESYGPSSSNLTKVFYLLFTMLSSPDYMV